MSDYTIDRMNVDDSQVALQGYSPVSYVDDHVAEQGTPEHRVEHNGVVYYLTSSDQVARFQADPARYEPAFGGWCAFGMSLGKRFRVDPASFEIVDGRLMVFLNDLETDARALWNQGDPAELASEAQQAWDDYAA